MASRKPARMPAERPAIVLVRPRNPNHIGAAARILSNFGFSDLRLVSPHPPVWEEARRSAVGAGDLLSKARVFPTLASAVADRSSVYAMSCLKSRRPDLPVSPLPGLRPGPGAAFVFGPEKTGLSSADLEHCAALVFIPTREECPSMNLAASVAVVCYELGGRRPAQRPAPQEERVPAGLLERLIEEAEGAMLRTGYRKEYTPQQRKSWVRRLLRRRGLTPEEAGFLFGFARRVTNLKSSVGLFPPTGRAGLF
jgi:tRNA/rRNA methyltransferase